jgi:hypothetical protein
MNASIFLLSNSNQEVFMGSTLCDAILDWMQNNRIRIASYDRIISSVPGASTPADIGAVVGNYPGIFRTATIKGGIPGLALVDSYQFPEQVPTVALNITDLSQPMTLDGHPIPTPDIPVGHVDLGSAEPTPTAPPVVSYAPKAQLTPTEAVRQLLDRAATTDVSGSALNFANAAVAAATANQLLIDAE